MKVVKLERRAIKPKMITLVEAGPEKMYIKHENSLKECLRWTPSQSQQARWR